MAHHIWCESLVYRVQKWVTKRVLTDKMIRMQYGLQTRVQYILVRTACAGRAVLFIVTILWDMFTIWRTIYGVSLCICPPFLKVEPKA